MLRLIFIAPLVTVAMCVGCGGPDAKPDRSASSTASESRQVSLASEPASAATPLGKVLALADIRNDRVWRSEEFAEHANAQLYRLSAFLAGKSTADELESVAAPEFTATPLFLPAGEVFSDHSFTITRAESFPAPSAVGLADVVTALREYLGPDVRTKFKIFKVHPGRPIYSATVLAGFATPDRELNTIWKTGWTPSAEDQRPLLASIELVSFEEVKRKSDAPLFADCTEAVLAHNSCYRDQLVYQATHWHGNLEVGFGIFQGNQGLALGDANGDGLDDVYVCQPDGLPNRFFVQQPDGRLDEQTAVSGLDLLDISRSPLFIDLDNDGDQDFAISHRFAVSIFENTGGARFVLRQTFQSESRTSGIAAADYDLDGDLDVFVCGYSPQSQTSPEDIFSNPVPYEDARNGAFNYLLRNEGAFRFVDATSGSGLDVNNTQFSFAAAWEDFDNDGDQDLYVANDFGRNNLYRNEVIPTGKAFFTDVADELGVLDIGAGMSVDWGDANQDGRMDLYVANMWSSAGNRITFLDQFKRGDDNQTREMLQRHARGNSLFLNSDAGFEDRSLEANVNMGRWAWGSLFVDLNNDSFEDIYITNGFMTAPDSGDL